jgi:hypothetical protein
MVEDGPGGVWEAVEDVYAGWHAAGEPERPDIGLSVEREGRQRVWLRRPEGCGWTSGPRGGLTADEMARRIGWRTWVHDRLRLVSERLPGSSAPVS